MDFASIAEAKVLENAHKLITHTKGRKPMVQDGENGYRFGKQNCRDWKGC